MKKSDLFAGAFLVSIWPWRRFAWGNGLNLNSLGTRALTMGGAFVGLADDFSAVFWNPAGAAGFRTEYLGFYGTDLIPTSKYRLDVPTRSGTATLVDAKTKMSHYLGGMVAYYHPVSDQPCPRRRRLHAVGPRRQLERIRLRRALRRNKAYDWSSKVGIVSISPLVA